MNAETQQRLITLLAAGIAFGMSHAVANRFIDIPEHGNERRRFGIGPQGRNDGGFDPPRLDHRWAGVFPVAESETSTSI